MPFHIDTSGLHQHYFPRRNSERTDADVRTKIVEHSSILEKEVQVSCIVRCIPDRTSFFSPLEEYRVLQGLAKESYLLYYRDAKAVSWTEWLYAHRTVRDVVRGIVGAFPHVLEALRRLHAYQVCFASFSPSHLCILDGKPLLCGFQHSFIDDVSSLEASVRSLRDFTYQPLEAHLLYYLVCEECATVSHGLVEECCTAFVAQLTRTVLRWFPERYREAYLAQCRLVLNTYVNQPKVHILQKILTKKHSWDIYSVSFMYLYLVGCIARSHDLRNTFFNRWMIALLRFLHPHPEKRGTLDDLATLLEREPTDEKMSYVDTLDIAKLHRYLESDH